MTRKKIAVVLFNLGGPDNRDAVKPFLFNLFNDPDILGISWPLRPLIAGLISSLRAPTARKIYAHLGGSSPLLANTKAQSNALSRLLNEEEDEYQVFVVMRYWHPRSDETARQIQDFAPHRIILLPLYPQFSKTTTGSSCKDWKRAARKIGLDVPTTTICCYPTVPGLIAAQKEQVKQALCGLQLDSPPRSRPRVLFSAHGLPKRTVAGGDPYQWQVEQTVARIVVELKDTPDVPDFDGIVCYQSRVGPMEWIGPPTTGELTRAGKDGVPVIVVPIAFVSEHAETLVELDVEYRRFAQEQGVTTYIRLPAVGVSAPFIGALKDLIKEAAGSDTSLRSCEGLRLCPQEFAHCLQ